MSAPFAAALLLLLGCLLPLQAAAETPTPSQGSAQTLWVSPAGSDDACASQEDPLATVEEALNRLRQIPYESAAIVLEEGTYYLTQPIRLTQGDHDITFCSQGEGRARLLGAVPITGWEETLVNGIPMWVAPVEHGAFHSLFSQEAESLPRTRWPKQGFFLIRSSTDPSAPDSSGRDLLGRYAMYVSDQEISAFRNPQDVTVKILHRWKDETVNIRELNPDTGRIQFSKPTTFCVESGERFYYENVFEALSEPGQWYLDSQEGRVYYVPRPGEDPETTTLYAPVSEQFLVCKGACNISFQNLDFAMSDWHIPEKTVNDDGSDHHQAAYDVGAAFEISDTKGIRFEGCSFRSILSTCLKFGNLVQDIQVTGNTFFQIGANAIFLVGRNTEKSLQQQTRTFRICNNHIDGYGQIFFNGTAIGILHAASGEISNNEIHRGYSIAITVGWVWGYGASVTKDILVRRNLIYDVGQELMSDMGAIYTLGVKEGVVITENVIHDVRANLEYGYGGWGIYMDEGSSNVMVTKNLVYDCNSTAFYQHYGRDNLIINNIFAFCDEAQVSSYRQEPHTGFHLIRNIVVSQNQEFIRLWDLEELQARSRMTEANNLYWDYEKGDRGIDCAYYTQTLGLFHNARFEDPLFANWQERDFTLSGSSPAISNGFIPWDISQAGLLRE